MKKKIVVVLCILASTFANAQQKIGYVYYEELIFSMPETKKAQTEIEAYKKVFQDQLVKMQADLESKYKSYEEGVKSGTLKDAMKELKEKEITDLQNNMQTTQQSAEEKIGKKQQEVLKPIQEKADKAIQDLAKEKGYTYIFDASAGGILFATPENNIIKDVQTKLGIKETPSPAPKPVVPRK